MTQQDYPWPDGALDNALDLLATDGAGYIMAVITAVIAGWSFIASTEAMIAGNYARANGIWLATMVVLFPACFGWAYNYYTRNVFAE